MIKQQNPIQEILLKHVLKKSDQHTMLKDPETIINQVHYQIESLGASAEDACQAVEDSLALAMIAVEWLRVLRNDMSRQMGDLTEPFSRQKHTHGLADVPAKLAVG